MSENTGIEWTDYTWNPWVGCTKITAGCANCYMFTGQERWGRDPSTLKRTKTWSDPLKWNRQAEAQGVRRRVFVCSWSDFFHRGADEWRAEAYDVMVACTSLDFQILTKRARRLPEHWGRAWSGSVVGVAPRNLWLGVSVENRRHGLPRIDILREMPAAVRFLSVEPLLENLDPLDLDGIHWVIVGGESGPGARPMAQCWAAAVIYRAKSQGVPVFFKQAGTVLAREWGCGDRKGGKPKEWPEGWNVRHFPEQPIDPPSPDTLKWARRERLRLSAADYSRRLAGAAEGDEDDEDEGELAPLLRGRQGLEPPS
jgi:protein gp37